MSEPIVGCLWSTSSPHLHTPSFSLSPFFSLLPIRKSPVPKFCRSRGTLPRHCQKLCILVSGRNRIWRRLSVFCLLSVKVCSWYKTHSNTGILAGVRYVSLVSVPGFQFAPVTVSFETFSGYTTMMYTMKVGFTIVNNLIRYRGLDCHLILQTVSRY